VRGVPVGVGSAPPVPGFADGVALGVAGRLVLGVEARLAAGIRTLGRAVGEGEALARADGLGVGLGLGLSVDGSNVETLSGSFVAVFTAELSANQATPTVTRLTPVQTVTSRDVGRTPSLCMSVMVRDMARVLLVEDDAEIRLALERALGNLGYQVRSSGNAMLGIREFTIWEPDIVVLDLGLPDLDGGSTLRMIRAVSDVPVIIATARNSEQEIVNLLNAGADEYVTKPFSAEQLGARIGALLRRVGTAKRSNLLHVGGLRLDLDAREATLDGERLQLSRREFDLLAYLANHPGRAITRRELLAQVWNQPYGGDFQTIDVHVSWLRRKLGEAASDPRYLHTVRGIGVKLVPPN